MRSARKRSSGTRLGHDQRDILAFDTVLFHSIFSSLQQKYLSNISNRQNSFECRPKLSKWPSEICYWWLKDKERKLDFRFVERILLAVINFTGSAGGALVPVFLRVTHWTKSGLPVSPSGLFPPWFKIPQSALWRIQNTTERFVTYSKRHRALCYVYLRFNLENWMAH